MANTDYIEQITNLERSMEKYVPKRMYDGLLSEYEEAERNNRAGLKEKYDSLTQEIVSRQHAANKEAVELYTLDTQEGNKVTTVKRPINICPYCGEKMVLTWDDNDNSRITYRSLYNHRNRPADYVVFSCLMCEAKSPKVSLSLRMLNESIIATEMGRVIDRAILEKEHAGDEDEDCWNKED